MISNHRTGERLRTTPARDVLCSNLSHGIHAAAQPLTILLAGLSKAHTDSMNMEQLRELAAGSYEEVQRVCTLFGYLQDLVMGESIKPHLSPTAISPLLTAAVEAAQPLFDKEGILLNSTLPRIGLLLLINGQRTLRAVASVLSTARVLSAAGGQVDLIASPSPSGMQIRISNAATPVVTISAEARLGMAAAEANVLSQHAAILWTQQPFSALIDLPKAPAGHP